MLLLCGAGVVRSRDRGESTGAREQPVLKSYAKTGIIILVFVQPPGPVLRLENMRVCGIGNVFFGYP